MSRRNQETWDKAYKYIKFTKDLIINDIQDPRCDPAKCIKSFKCVYNIYCPTLIDFTERDVAGWMFLYKYNHDKRFFMRGFSHVRDAAEVGSKMRKEYYPTKEFIGCWLACNFIRSSRSFVSRNALSMRWGEEFYVFNRKSFK